MSSIERFILLVLFTLFSSSLTLIFSPALFYKIFSFDYKGRTEPIGKLSTTASVVRQPSGSLAWFVSNNSLPNLYVNDLIFTDENPLTTMNFGEEGSLDLGPNSLLQIAMKDGRPFLNVISGQLRKTSPSDKPILIKSGSSKAIALTTEDKGVNDAKEDIQVEENRIGITSGRPKELGFFYLRKGENLTNSLVPKNQQVTVLRLPQESRTGTFADIQKWVPEKSGPHQIQVQGDKLLPTKYNLEVVLFSPLFLEKPLDGEQIDKEDIKLSWKELPGVDNYQVELATDAQFKNDLIQMETTTNEVTLRNRKKDQFWYWRVRFQDSQKTILTSVKRGFMHQPSLAAKSSAPKIDPEATASKIPDEPTGETLKAIKKVPTSNPTAAAPAPKNEVDVNKVEKKQIKKEKVKLLPPQDIKYVHRNNIFNRVNDFQSKESTLEVKWPSVENAHSYSWQLSKNTQFKKIFKSGGNNQPQMKLNLSDSSDLYFRAKAVSLQDSAFESSDYSTPLKMTLSRTLKLQKPQILEPKKLTKIVSFGSKPVPALFSWQHGDDKVDKFQLQIANAPTFDQVIFDKEISAFEYIYTLKDTKDSIFCRIRAIYKNFRSEWNDDCTIQIQRK